MMLVLALLLALNLVALVSWIVLLVHVARLVGALASEQKATRRDLDLHAYGLAAQLAADNEERRKHLNLVQGTILGHVSGTVAQLERLLCPDAPRAQLHMVWPLPMRPRTRRRRPASGPVRRAAA